MTELVLISCSKSKESGVDTAEEKYEPSAIFRKRRKLAKQRGDHLGVLSGKYGYLRRWDWIPYYEKHIDDRSPVWGAFVMRDLQRDIDYYDVDTVTILAGSSHVDPLVGPLEAQGIDVVDYNHGLRPGERMHALDEAVKPGRQERFATAGGGQA